MKWNLNQILWLVCEIAMKAQHLVPSWKFDLVKINHSVELFSFQDFRNSIVGNLEISVGLVMWGIFHWSAVCTFLNSLLYKIVFTTKIQLNRNVCVFHTPTKEIALKYIYIQADFIINLHISQYTIEPYLFCYYYSCVVICFYGIFERIIRLFFYIHISTRTKTFGNFIRFIIKISYCIEVDFFSFIHSVGDIKQTIWFWHFIFQI